MTKWRFFLCECGKYFRVRPGIEQRDLTCPNCGKSGLLVKVKKRQYERGIKRQTKDGYDND